MAVVVSVDIARQPQDVFTYTLEPLHYPEWDDSIISAHREDQSPLAVGSKTTVLHRMGPLKMPTIEELIEFDPPRLFTNRGVSGRMAGVARCTVEPLEGGQRARLTITLTLEARGYGKLILPLAEARARKSLPKQVKKLKEILDNGGETLAGTG